MGVVIPNREYCTKCNKISMKQQKILADGTVTYKCELCGLEKKVSYYKKSLMSNAEKLLKE